MVASFEFGSNGDGTGGAGAGAGFEETAGLSGSGVSANALVSGADNSVDPPIGPFAVYPTSPGLAHVLYQRLDMAYANTFVLVLLLLAAMPHDGKLEV